MKKNILFLFASLLFSMLCHSAHVLDIDGEKGHRDITLSNDNLDTSNMELLVQEIPKQKSPDINVKVSLLTLSKTIIKEQMKQNSVGVYQECQEDENNDFGRLVPGIDTILSMTIHISKLGFNLDEISKGSIVSDAIIDYFLAELKKRQNRSL